ncbi:MAG: 3,4-dihydroxy 2-butanone 4-phosphate synthase / cyclohydrolase [Thermotogota bacterium]|nr:3,4-dihydroxy 2-butanone 4-phosphate synthase / cyclohydrolase [Thermotogota bacterium]MDK2865669.1 3,4-dihydroxy 2-butanone 4-phosphate synthase / cyclohydrolase [Thermotogota bacterium]
MNVDEVKRATLRGKPIILLDDEFEGEADLVFPAQIVNKDTMNLFLQKGRGLLCVTALEEDLISRGFFKLSSNQTGHVTNFFIPVDYGSGTGVSASERAKTARMVAAGEPLNKFCYPGHVQLLGAKSMVERQGHTEASVELMELLGFSKHAVITEILDEDGNSHNFEYIRKLAVELDVPILKNEQVRVEVIKKKRFFRVVGEAALPTRFGNVKIVAFENHFDRKEHFAIYSGRLREPVNVRIHSECATGDVLGSLRCDCGDQLSNALRFLSERGGVLLYLRQEGRGIGITNKIKAYELQEEGMDTVEANLKLGFKEDERDYAVAAQMLKALGLQRIRLLTNNPNKVEQLRLYGISVQSVEPIVGRLRRENMFYLKTKMDRLGHDLGVLFEEVER